ncbi:MAG: thioredoxin [Candidatus Midichloria sp.]|nr:MAG: thioredoxin [Candidatus Midichloria sp.]
MVSSVTDSDFSSAISNSKGYALVDFWAEWCGPCRQLSPIIDEVSKVMEGKVAVYKLNINENPESASQLGIRSIPTLILFKDGAKADVKVGLMTKTALIDWLQSKINA